MSSLLPFDRVKKGTSDHITPAMFVAGSGLLDMQCVDKAETTADGKIHWTRMAINRRARLLAFENVLTLMSELTTNADLASTTQNFVLMQGLTTVYSRRGVMGGNYVASRNVTQVDILYDSELAYPA